MSTHFAATPEAGPARPLDDLSLREASMPLLFESSLSAGAPDSVTEAICAVRRSMFSRFSW